MKEISEFQKIHYRAIQGFYQEVNRKLDKDCNMKDVIISWLTDGYAEKFRQRYLRKRSVVVS
ncbi:MAG: hypothetical protein EH225_03430 [Calditrichaeota bacterium]|nr:hypothetical protein [Calditrichota bacterium]RQW06380.1 MAG: hypothetical protein EH225_03430 [Calditrichota bacterium]